MNWQVNNFNIFAQWPVSTFIFLIVKKHVTIAIFTFPQRVTMTT